MELDTETCLKKTLIDTQERVRDFMIYSKKIEDGELKNFFEKYAKTEGEQARKLQEYIESLPQ